MNIRSMTFAAGILFLAGTLSGCYVEEYNTQRFGAGEATCLSGKRLFFDDRSNPQKSAPLPHRDRFVSEQTTLPIDPTEHETADFSQADPFTWALSSDIDFVDPESPFATLFIGSDGTIAFGAPGTGNRTLIDYYSSFQISLLPVDATLGGAVRYGIHGDAVVITYENVGGNTFQCELYIRGDRLEDIVFSYPMVGENTLVGVVGNQSASPPGGDLDVFVAITFVDSNLCEDSPLNRPAIE